MRTKIRQPLVALLALAWVFLALSCERDPPLAPENEAPRPLDLALPPEVIALLGSPPMPDANPLTVEGVALGRRLFHDKSLSNDHTLACSSCHLQANAFSDPRPFSVGTDGTVGTRNAMSIANMAWSGRFFWDGRAIGLEGQAHDPVTDPREMRNTWPVVEERLNASAEYRELFMDAFGTDRIDSQLVVMAIAQFERNLLSFGSPFDRFWLQGDSTAISGEALSGFELFTSQGRCGNCHVPGLFTDNQFRNNGLDTDPVDPGYGQVTGLSADMGKFKVPTLRNIALTAPYMHDSRFATLEEAVGHYNGGVQMLSPNLDPIMEYWGMNPAPFTANEVNKIVAFLNTLTDQSFVTDPAFGEP